MLVPPLRKWERMMNRHHKVPLGAEVEHGGVRFRLWAPRAVGVSLRLEGDHPSDLPMEESPTAPLS